MSLILLIWVLAAVPKDGFGQNQQDFNLAIDIVKPPQRDVYPYTYRGEAEIIEFLRLLFSGYKYFISSQDMQTCNFYPSCSVYAMHSIEKKGLIWGFFNSIDRISRCHPLGLQHYQYHPETGLAYDPVNP